MLEEAKKKGYEGFDEIILVGGSTRMPQIKSRIDENFNTDAKSFDPDEAVAKGAAMFGWNTSISDRLIEEIAANTGKKAEEINLSEVDDGVKEKVEQKFADNTGLTLNDVKKAQKKIGTVASKSFGVIAFDENDVEKLFNLIIKK
jgi:molecular chaperone DnaK